MCSIQLVMWYQYGGKVSILMFISMYVKSTLGVWVENYFIKYYNKKSHKQPPVVFFQSTGVVSVNAALFAVFTVSSFWNVTRHSEGNAVIQH